jgi:hypothetical protein
MITNPYKNKAYLYIFLSVLILLFIYTGNAPILGVGGTFFVVLLCLLFIIPSLSKSKCVDRILKGEKLANWTYSQQKWDDYIKINVQIEKRKVRNFMLFVGVVIFALAYAAWWSIKEGTQKIIFIIAVLVSPMIIWAILIFSVSLRGKNRRHTFRESLITTTGVYINDSAYLFNNKGGAESELKKVEIEEDQEMMTFFVRTVRPMKRGSMGGRVEIINEIKVPIPPGEMENAKRILGRFKNFHP